jgi:hypothetical protein
MVPVRASRLTGWLLVLLLPLMAAADAPDFERKWQEAEALRAEAAEAGAEWLNTGALLQQAREAASDGDPDTALKLVEQARFQAEAALKQAEREAEMWQHRVLR